ncbi:MAG: hypothetical protein L0287_04565 [Anaerolineae bacterium]|nr:hypothetical protein [Anaerolineae bacterium]MCI0610176.1 hypothetical protein [Anaerolineae bacterium]
MRHLLIPILLVLLVACAPPLETASQINQPVPTISSTVLAEAKVATSTPLPTPQATLSIITFGSPGFEDVPVETITSFAEIPGNQATGQPAADFTARLLGGGTFVLSEERGKYWLVLPTALGCGDCMYSLYLLDQAQPQNPASLNILVLNVYQPDLPEYWLSLAEAIDQPNYFWAALDTPTFLEDYAIYGLGTFLVIDPNGKLVFQSDSPPPPEYIAHLFELAQSEGAKCENEC